MAAFKGGIRQVGQKAGKVLAARFRTLDALQGATLEELTGVDDIGAITAQSLLDWFASPLEPAPHLAVCGRPG